MNHKNEKKYSENDMKIISLETCINNINETLIRFERRFDSVEQKIDSLNSRIWFNFYWMIGGFATILGFLAHAMKWI